MFIGNIRTSGVTESEPSWGPVLLMIFVATMLFCLLNIFLAMALHAYREAKAALACEEQNYKLSVSDFVYYKLLRHWLNCLRQVNFDSIGNEASQYNVFESTV